ncbi:MAG: S8 family peptidase [Planctomycetaceae bacterium]
MREQGMVMRHLASVAGRCTLRSLLTCVSLATALAPALSHAIVGSDSSATAFNGTYVNSVIGAGTFYSLGFGGSRTIVANIEAGTIWNGHETLTGRVSQFLADPAIVATGTTQLGQFDWHATMVGQALGGTGLYTYQDGIAPMAQLWSGAIATQWIPSPGGDFTGSFDATDASFFYPYVTAMRMGVTSGTSSLKAQVVNSSWGYPDSAGEASWTIAIDALARENNVVTVFAAGNEGPATNTVGGPASGYNGIAVAATTGAMTASPFSTVAEFSSRGPGDFYNPVSGTTVPNVRPTVDIAAPGDELTLGFYGGLTGGHTSGSAVTGSDLYVPGMNGTSFAAPIVAGGAALMIDAATFVSPAVTNTTEMLDARVIKATMMAAATVTNGWNNGQQSVGGVITTAQALDHSAGAGMINLDRAYRTYVGDPTVVDIGGMSYLIAGVNTTLGVTGSSGGSGLDLRGWDLGTVLNDADAESGNVNAYAFASMLPAGGTLTAALTWFADRTVGSTVASAADVALANLSLQLYRTDAVGGPSLVAQSIAPYSSSEFLRLTLPAYGYYELRVLGLDEVYNTLGTPLTTTDYGLSWVVTVPEPTTYTLAAIGLAIIAQHHRRRRGSRRMLKEQNHRRPIPHTGGEGSATARGAFGPSLRGPPRRDCCRLLAGSLG